MYVGICYLLEGELNESLEHFNKAIELNPQMSEAWNNKGFVLEELGNYEGAIEAYNKSIELNPQMSEAWYNRACVYSLMKNTHDIL